MDVGGRDKANRLYYVSLFALFGLLIAFCTSILNYRLDFVSMEEKLTGDAEEVFDLKIRDFEHFTAGLENIVEALRDTSLLYSYLEDPGPGNYDDVAACFRTIANSNASLMQVRYIDEFGMERVRVDWPVGRQKASLVPANLLQDKKDRYYFKEASQIPPFSFWYSKLDLNIENGRIENPEKPVLRIASPVYVNQEFRGIVIINVHVKEFLNKFLYNSVFDICLIDRDGYLLVSHDPDKSWSKYRETGYSVESVYPDYASRILHHGTGGELRKIDKLFVGSLGDLLEKDGAMLLLHADEKTIKSMKEERQKAAVFIVAIIVLLSVPLALLISRGPSKLHRKISRQNRQLTESIELIDKNIHRGTLDLQRNFQEASSALVSSLGVTTSSIVGMKYAALYCEGRPKEYYDEVWETLAREGSWAGELQHSKKNGECFWADTVVLPKKDDDGILIGYSVIYQDITDKKRIEELSITDELTGLYNRRFFNLMIVKELGRARREQKNIVFAMLDIDFFKQYNDNYGHQKGDVVLKEVAKVMGTMLSRGSDYCFRLGGEEFGVLFISQESSDSFEFIDSIREKIEERALEHKWSEVASVITVSIGMLTIEPGDSVSVDTVYRIADKALYAAKNEGRNRVVANNFDVTTDTLVD
ncbi:MAG: diguanylate cyclase (GGDEF)-like protein/PAS domain S-box-containing protein [Desulforhopalus sp.]|jgi:diguanylate cyclase (GGDEF)-like protein/PAS domain S-box-containing protein